MQICFDKRQWSKSPRLILAIISVILAGVGIGFSIYYSNVSCLIFGLLLLLNLFTYKFEAKSLWVLSLSAALVSSFFSIYLILIVNAVDYDRFDESVSLFIAHQIYRSLDVVVFEILIALAVYLLLKLFFVPTKAAMIVTPIPFLIYGIANYEIWQVRGSDLLFSDFFTIATAANVAGEYTFPILVPLVFGIIPYILYVLFVSRITCEKSTAKAYTRFSINLLTVLLSLTICIGFYTNYRERMDIHLWQHEGTLINTSLMNFLLSWDNFYPDKPEDYSTDSINAYLEEAQIDTEIVTDDNSTNEYSGDEQTNIIVIMNESFTDPDFYGDNLPIDEDPIPYWHSLSENTIHGTACVGIFGGNTANSEFEFLTSISTAYISAGVVPYNLYLGQDTYSLPYYLDSLGYRTIAMHPYESSGWNRTTVYPNLGFQEMYFIDDFEVSEDDLIRNYMSDSSAYSNLMDIIEEDDDQPVFALLVTMQNHGGYTPDDEDNFEEHTYVDGVFSELYDGMTNEYLSLIHESDIALEELLTYLSDLDERYVVVMFGDHHPNLMWNAYGNSCGDISAQIPYIIWTNYDMPEDVADENYSHIGLTSVPYMALDVMAAAGIELNPYYDFIESIRETIPTLNQYTYISEASGGTLALDDASDPQEAYMLNMFHYFQYDTLFDRSHSNNLELYTSAQISAVNADLGL